jgi:multiple sugar transport system substrate-binding protein
VIANFEKKYPYITVKGEPRDISAYFTQLATETAAGTAPDVMTLGGAYPLAYAARGALLDMSTVKDQLDTTTFPKSILTSATYKNKLYGVPTGANALAVIADPAVFKAAGVAMPDDNTWTWEDFESIAKKITAGSPKGPFGAEDRVADLIGAYTAQRGPGLYNAKGDLVVKSSTLADMWSMEKKLVDNGGMPSASLTQEIIQAAPAQTLMGQGKSGMIFAYTNQLSAYEDAAGKDLVLLRLPGETEYKQPGMTLLPSQYYSLYSKSAHPRQAALLVNYLVNSTAAGKLILEDRGLPSNEKVRNAIQPLLPAGDQASAEFVNRISKLVGPAGAPSPASASNQNTITYSIDSNVLFGKQSPSDAAAAWISQMKASMAASVQ